MYGGFIMLITDTDRGTLNGLNVAKTGPNVNMLRRLAKLIMDEVNDIEESDDLVLGNGFKLDRYVENFEINIIRYALQLSSYNQLAASRLLGIKPTTLNAKIKRYGLFANDGITSQWPTMVRNAPVNSALLRRRNRKAIL